MPTLTITREAPLELIRQCPDLAVDLVRAMTGVPLLDDLPGVGEQQLRDRPLTAPSQITRSGRAVRRSGRIPP